MKLNKVFRLKLQQKFASFKQRHNNVFRKSKNLSSSPRPFFQEIDLSPGQPESEERAPSGGRKYGKRIDQIRKKLREVLAYSSSKSSETTSSIERTFLPSHLKSEIISPTLTREIDLTTTHPQHQIFKPEFRKNILGRLSRKRIPQPESEESSEEIITDNPADLDTTSPGNDQDDYVEIVSSKVTSDSVNTNFVVPQPPSASTPSSFIVPKPTVAPIPSTKTISGQFPLCNQSNILTSKLQRNTSEVFL